MSEAECRTANWESVGREDGARGADLTGISRHERACSQYGLSPDPQAYERGRVAGVAAYCRPQNGYALGEAGTAYTGVCPADLEERFLDRYEYGGRVREARQLVINTSSRISQIDKRLEEIRKKLNRRINAVVADDRSKAEKAETLNSALDLAREGELLAAERAELKVRLPTYEADLNRLLREGRDR
jgi:predicted ribosome quality control (RQC) complex YloA/Tae2 family protein